MTAPDRGLCLALWLPLLFLVGLIVPPLLLLLAWVLSINLAVAPVSSKRRSCLVPQYVLGTASPRSPPLL